MPSLGFLVTDFVIIAPNFDKSTKSDIKSSVIKRNTNSTLLQDKRDPEIVFEEYSVD